MSALTPWTALGLELLADGEWRDKEWLTQKMMPKVPPGRAMRFAERARVQQYDGEEPRPRTRERSDDYLIRVGRRGVVQQTLHSWKRLERKTEDGKAWVRLREPRPLGRRAQPQPVVAPQLDAGGDLRSGDE